MASLLFKATMSDMYINIISGRGWSFRSMFDRPALPHGTPFHCPRSWRPEVDFFFLEKEKKKKKKEGKRVQKCDGVASLGEMS